MSAAHDRNIAEIKRLMMQPPRAAIESNDLAISNIFRWWKQVTSQDKHARTWAKASMSTAVLFIVESNPEVAGELDWLLSVSREL